MERLCFVLKLAEGAEAEYDERHATIWPELSASIAAAGHSNYTLFRAGATVIGYAECRPDVETARANLSRTEISARWQRYMATLMDPTNAHNRWVRATEVWHLPEPMG